MMRWTSAQKFYLLPVVIFAVAFPALVYLNRQAPTIPPNVEIGNVRDHYESLYDNGTAKIVVRIPDGLYVFYYANRWWRGYRDFEDFDDSWKCYRLDFISKAEEDRVIALEKERISSEPETQHVRRKHFTAQEAELERMAKWYATHRPRSSWPATFAQHSGVDTEANP
jgi:hypothetical protein